MGRGCAVSSKPGPRKEHEDAASAASSVFSFSVDFLDSALDKPIIEDRNFEEDAPWDLQKLTSMDDCGPSSTQRAQ